MKKIALLVFLVTLPAHAQIGMQKVVPVLAIKANTAILWIKRDVLIERIGAHLRKSPAMREWAREYLKRHP